MTEKTEQMTVGLVDTVPALEEKLAALRTAQAKFATYTQEQVDCIFRAAALAANQARIPLAKMAVAETGMGVVNCSRKNDSQKQICSANVGCSPTPRQHF